MRGGLDLIACRSVDPELFFDEARVAEAKRVCRGCPVQVVCLAGAIARDEPCGVWGGEAFPRVAMVVAHVRPAVYAPAHGSRKRYCAGCHCDLCTKANAAYIAQWRQQREWSVPVVRETPPEQLDLFGPVTASERVMA